MAERSVKTVEDLLSKENSLEDILLAYRATPLASGFSPAQLVFGRRIRSKFGLHGDQKTEYSSFERLNESVKAFSKKKWDSKHRALQLPQLTVGSRVWVNAPQDRGSEGEVVRKDDSPHSFWVRVGPSLLRRNCKHLALLPERVSPRVFRDEHPKRDLTPETAVTKPGLQGSPVSREGSQENHDPGDRGSTGEETQGKESSSLQPSMLPVVTRSGRIA